jgi:hypothetical protein
MATSTSGTSIPAPTTCQDTLAINYGAQEPCKYAGHDPEHCETCNGNGNGNGNGAASNGTNGNGTTFLGMKMTNWVWIILGAIVVYYFWKKRG